MIAVLNAIRQQPFDKPNEPKAAVSAGYHVLKHFFKSLLCYRNGTSETLKSYHWLSMTIWPHAGEAGLHLLCPTLPDVK